MSASDSYITPRELTEPLGQFNLDPCRFCFQPWQHARHSYDLALGEDGLVLPWFGRVWLNGPYSDLTPWMRRLARYGRGTALVNVCPTTRWWKKWVWPHAFAIRFLSKRVRHYRYRNLLQIELAANPSKDSALVAYGAYDAAKLLEIDANPPPILAGHTIVLRTTSPGMGRPGT